MADALTALEQINADVGRFTDAVERSRGKTVPADRVRPLARSIAITYFESVRTELDAVKLRAGLVDEIDFVMNALLTLSTGPREQSAYLGQLNELRPYLAEALIDLMRARGAPRLVLSTTERGILDTLTKLLPTTAASYEQVMRDSQGGKRISWRGTGAELREILREVIDHLAPDDQVLQAPGFKLEADRKGPTQKQKVRFIFRARKGKGKKSAAETVAEETLGTFEEGIASLARPTYERGSASTHAATDATEIKRLKGYVDALLVDLLEVAN
jgi:hypothetical protein